MADIGVKLAMDLNNRFRFHEVKPGQAEQYEKIRENAKGLAWLICEECPESRERSLALTYLEQAVFNANAAIARHG